MSVAAAPPAPGLAGLSVAEAATPLQRGGAAAGFLGVPWVGDLLGRAWPSPRGWAFFLLALVTMPLIDAGRKTLVGRRAPGS